MGVRGVLVVRPRGEDELVPLVGSRFSAAMPIANEALVRYGARSLRQAGVGSVIVAGPPAAREEMLAALGDDHGLDLEWADVEHRGAALLPDAAAALAAAAPLLGEEHAVVHFSDTLSLTPLGPLVEEAGAADVLLAGPEGSAADSPVVSLSDHRERRKEPALPSVAPARIALLSPAAVEAAAGLPPEAALHDIALAVSRTGGSSQQRLLRGVWSCSGTVDGVLEANRLVLDAIDGEVEGADLSSARVDGRVRVHPTAVLDRTTVRGPATIGPGTVLVDTFIGPYTAIGDNVRLEGTEIEYSIVLRGASIRHPGRRLEASLVGQDASVSRDFALPSSLRLRVGRRADISLT